MGVVPTEDFPSLSASQSSNLRYWLCGAVLCLYFATFASLFFLSRAANGGEQPASGISLSLTLTVTCMIACVMTTVVFVFARRGE